MRFASCSILVACLLLQSIVIADEKLSSEVEQLRKEIAKLEEVNAKTKEELKVLRGFVDHGNLLLQLTNSRYATLGAKPALQEQLNKGKVKTVKEAEKLALQHHMKLAGGLGAMQSWGVHRLFRLGSPIPGFAESGSLIWVVHVQRSLGLSPRNGINQIIWIDNATGKMRTLMPFGRQPRLRVTPPTDSRKASSDSAVNWIGYVLQPNKTWPDNVNKKLATLKKSTIATLDDARSVMGTFYFEATGNLTIKDHVEVTDLFELGTDVNGFGKKGDLIWQTRVIKKGAGVVLTGWISSSSGELRLIGMDKPDPKRLNRANPHLIQQLIPK